MLEQLAFELLAQAGLRRDHCRRPRRSGRDRAADVLRYFASKDLVRGDDEQHLRRLRHLLEDTDLKVPMIEAGRRAVVEFDRFDPTLVPWHRQRMELILGVPTLQADATLRMVITEFVAKRTGLPASTVFPRLAGNGVLAAAVAAY